MRSISRRNFIGSSAALGLGLGLAACSSDDSSSSESSSGTDTSSSSDASDENLSRIADDDMISAAKEDGQLVVYGSCEEQHVAACCEHFQELFGIETSYQRLSTGEVESKIEEENGNPSADVWFGGTTDPYNVAVNKGLLQAYEAKNASHLISDVYRDADGYWYGIYKGILGFFYNTDEIDRLGIDAPQDWPDLLDSKYQDLIWMSNYNTAGTAKLILNTVIQKYGHDEGIQYLVDLDKNIAVYTKSGSGPSKNVGTGECTVGIGFLHDAIYQIVDNGYNNIGLVIPSSGASYEIGATAIFNGATHQNAAKLWIEYALSPQCVERAQEVGAYQFLVIDDAKQPQVATDYGLDPDNVMDYDFEDAKENTETYVSDIMTALANSGTNTDDTSRFQTE
ncbi:MAG: ABC transporter substrate-binding protein [Tractidigestivibacter sp.]|jgi:iron(III) transport system substrate-binding protein|uniref:ABC transporter substrate-binding protein n=1 Tax=Tractidigestivibacter sp. TaxID=2847320 RepID=UPI003D9477E5